MSVKLTITDRDVISVTLRFIYNTYKLGTDQPIQKWYDITVLTKKDITCDEFMTGIRVGLQKRLGDKYDDQKIIRFVMDSNSRTRSSCTEDDYYGKPEVDKVDFDIYCICLNIFYQCYKDFYLHQELIIEENPLDKKLPSRVTINNINFRKFKSTFVNSDAAFNYSHTDAIGLYSAFEGKSTLDDIGFVSSTIVKFDVSAENDIENLFEDNISQAFLDEVPHYNISETHLFMLDKEPVKIIPPSSPPDKPKGSLILGILSSVIMMVAMVAGRSFIGGVSNFKSFVPYIAVMIVASIAVSLINRFVGFREYKANLKDWQTHYQAYVNRIASEIESKQNIDIQQLNYLYPPNINLIKAGIQQEVDTDDQGVDFEGRSVVDLAARVSGEIFSRGQEHPEFMKVRLGKSTSNSMLVPSVFEIQGEKKDEVFTSARFRDVSKDHLTSFRIFNPEKNKGDSQDPYLIDLPAHLATKYRYLKGAPVLLDVKKCGTVGLVFDKTMDFQPFLENFIMNLCFYQSPDDIQFIYFAQSYEDYKNELNGVPSISKWEYEQLKIDKFKDLPHFKELTGNVSSFAFNSNDASALMNLVLEILMNRKENKEKTHQTQIIVIIEEEYNIKRHALSEFLPEYIEGKDLPDYGISFVFCSRYEEQLPKYCGEVIRCEMDKTLKSLRWYMLPHIQKVLRHETLEIPQENKKNRWNLIKKDNKENIQQDAGASLTNVLTELDKTNYEFIPDAFCPGENETEYKDVDNKRKDYNKTFNIIGSLYYDRIEQGAGIPGSKTLFELIKDSDKITSHGHQLLEDVTTLTAKSTDELGKIKERIENYINENWNEKNPLRNVTESLSVDIGYKEEAGLVNLDLHESSDGPHMLVAGTTGSGKTESILTYLIMLCLLYTPKQVNLLLMDMKGAGFVKRIGDLPHVVGKVTDIDGDENGTSMEYTLKRFLKSMDSEVKERKRRLSKMGVDSIDKYVKAQADIDDHIKHVLKLDPNKYNDPDKKAEIQKKIEEIKELKNKPMPHLFVVIDEFTELMRFSSDNSDIDFKSQITSLARIGRSLGYHIILISQNIEGAITDDIRVNSKARFCLKVATRQASKDMIGTDLAASPLMPGNGRAYLLIGTGSRRDYFQTAYSGALAVFDSDKEISLTLVSQSGPYQEFYNSKAKDKEKLKRDWILEEVLSDDVIKKNHPELESMIHDESNSEESTELTKGEEQKSETTLLVCSTENGKSISDNQIQDDIKIDAGFEKDSKDSTQIQILAEVITKYAKENKIQSSHKVFQEPLPTNCYFDFDKQKEIRISMNQS